jgi:hypothetical protein
MKTSEQWILPHRAFHVPCLQRGVLLLVCLLLFAVSPLAAETAEGPAQGTLWARLNVSALTGHGGWDAAGERIDGEVLNYLAFGADLEYGVTPWVSLFGRWEPGYLHSAVAGAGEAGTMGDLRFGLRLGVAGERALIKTGFLRVAVLAGVKMPLPSGEDTAWEPGTRLWGAGFGLSVDYIPLPWLQVNLSGDVLVNPEQISDNPAYGRRGVDHALDMVFSLEPRLSILNPDGVILGLPVVYEYSPESERAGVGLGDERRLLSAGCSYTLAARSAAWPFEVTVKYLAPIDGMNRIREQRLSLSGKVEIPCK